MTGKDFNEVITLIRAEDPRYAEDAYFFIRSALDDTMKQHKRTGKLKTGNHVSAAQLLKGIRTYALGQYGPLTLTVLQNWGVTTCEDFGNLVFNLVDYGILGKTDEDRREDFTKGYTFEEAFEAPFKPKNPQKPITPEAKPNEEQKG